MHFTIITPSFNQLELLRRCVASVADQATKCMVQEARGRGILPSTIPKRIADNSTKGNSAQGTVHHQPPTALSIHHHIQDGGSTDGTCEWLAEHAMDTRPQKANGCTFSYESAPDNGMYDALNRGIDACLGVEVGGLKSDGVTSNPQPPDDSIIAWLNCDEQYLSGTLHKMAACFSLHPDVDILCGDVLLVDAEGALLAYRKGYAPRRAYIEASHLYTLSCATFYRHSVFGQVGPFDTTFKAAADEDFFLRALRLGFRARHIPAYLSAFTLAEGNLGGGAVALKEHLELKRRASGWIRWCRPAVNAMRLAEKVLSGAYAQKFPLEYALYDGSDERRRCHVAASSSWRWPRANR